MKYAKLWLNRWIIFNYGKYDEKTFHRKLNWSIVNLSHRVCKIKGAIGHSNRQTIRKKLWDYCIIELKHYQPSMLNKILGYIRRIIRKK